MSLGFVIPKGDARQVRCRLTYADGTPAYLAGATVTGKFRKVGAADETAIDLDCTVVDPASLPEDATGEITCDIDGDATAELGRFRLSFKVEFPTGLSPVTFPSRAPYIVVIREET